MTGNRFQSRGPHAYIFVAVPFGVALVAAAALGVLLGNLDVFTLIGALAIAAWGVWVLLSSAYSCWGTVEVTRADNLLSLTRALGSLSRREQFASTAIRSVEYYTPPPGIMMFPGSAGPQLRVFLEHRARPLTIGAGLCLDEQELKSIEQLLCTRT